MECYLDNSATTKPCKAAVDAEISALTELYGNPSSLHQKGVDAYMLLEKSRGTIAASLKASLDEIYFTPAAPCQTTPRYSVQSAQKATRQENSHYGFRASER